MTNEVIVNKVAQSGIITLNLEDFYPNEPIVTFDIKDYLFMGLILKEKDFRTALKEHNWSKYTNMNVAIICSADAIIPYWAYMLIASNLKPFAHFFMYANEQTLQNYLFLNAISQINTTLYAKQRVVIKGCGEKPIPPAAYVEITRILSPIVKSLMYGEPCSTVPILKNADI